MAYGSYIHVETEAGTPDDQRPELSDLGRYGRMLVRGFVRKARAAEQPTFRSIIADHLGVAVDELQVVEEHWPAYEHVNVQAALDAWLSEPDRSHRLVGLSDYRHRGPFGLADLLGQDRAIRHGGPWPGNVTRTGLPSGPSGETRECLQAALVLVGDGPDRIAILFRGADPESDQRGVSVEVVANVEGAPRNSPRGCASWRSSSTSTADTSSPSAAACSANEGHCCASTSAPG